MAMLSLMSTIFNGIWIPILLNYLGMYKLTRARAINMKNAIAQVEECRNKLVSNSVVLITLIVVEINTLF